MIGMMTLRHVLPLSFQLLMLQAEELKRNPGTKTGRKG